MRYAGDDKRKVAELEDLHDIVAYSARDEAGLACTVFQWSALCSLTCPSWHHELSGSLSIEGHLSWDEVGLKGGRKRGFWGFSSDGRPTSVRVLVVTNKFRGLSAPFVIVRKSRQDKFRPTKSQNGFRPPFVTLVPTKSTKGGRETASLGLLSTPECRSQEKESLSMYPVKGLAFSSTFLC